MQGAREHHRQAFQAEAGPAGPHNRAEGTPRGRARPPARLGAVPEGKPVLAPPAKELHTTPNHGRRNLPPWCSHGGAQCTSYLRSWPQEPVQRIQCWRTWPQARELHAGCFNVCFTFAACTTPGQCEPDQLRRERELPDARAYAPRDGSPRTLPQWRRRNKLGWEYWQQCIQCIS